MIDTIASFIVDHPHWVGFAIFIATALESMAFIGSLFPGMSIVLVLSGVAASLGSNIWILVLWCIIGAIIGDGASFWLGHRYGDHLKAIWPFRTRPELLEKGTEFFHSNGGKSIFVGRFLPFTRAIVPIAAGMLGMNPVRFYIANILSAIGWALMNILPAAGLGLAFTAINQASSRVAAMLGVFMSLFILALLSGHIFVRAVLPRLEVGFTRVYEKLQRGPKWAAGIASWIFGSDARLATTSAVWIVLTSSLVLFFAKVFEDVLTNDPLVRMDIALNTLVQSFRNPVGDRIMSILTSMGDATVVFGASAALVLGLLIFRAWQTSIVTFFVLATTAAFVPLLKWTLHKPRPIDLYSGAEAFSFPSGHAAFSAIVWGLIVVIGARGLSKKAQATLWALAFTMSVMVGLSRVYLSAHWPSDVMGGLLFGWIMASVFGLIEMRIREPIAKPRILGLGVLLVLIVAWGYHATVSIDKNLERYQARKHVVSISLSDWRKGGWKRIPLARIDLKGEYEEPLSFQIAMPSAEIENVLRSVDWTRKPTMDWRQATQFFRGRRELSSLAPLPLLHNGTPPILTMVTTPYADDRRDVFRLWRTDVEIRDLPGHPAVLVGSVTQERVTHPIIGINILRDTPSPPYIARNVATQFEVKQELCLFSTTLNNNDNSPSLVFPGNIDSCSNNERPMRKIR